MSRVQSSEGYGGCFETALVHWGFPHRRYAHKRWQCNHHDLSLFKRSYDARQTLQGRASQASQPTGHPPAASPLSSSIPAQQQGCPLQPESTSRRDIDLRGVSANPANNPVDLSSPASDAADQDILSLVQAPWSTTTSSAGHLRLSSTHQPAYSTTTFPRRPSLMLSSSPLPVPSTKIPTHQSRYLPIGRQVSAESDLWECQCAHSSDGTDSLASFYDDATACLQHCGSLSHLSEHYRRTHGAFREDDPPFMWKCRSCQFLNRYPQPCPHCLHPRPAWEKWYYGYVTAPDVFASMSATFVQTPDPASGFATSPDSTLSSQGYYSFPGFTSFTSVCYSPGSGTGSSFLQLFPGTLPEVVEGRYPSNSSLYIPLLIPLLALALYLKAYCLVSDCEGVVPRWAKHSAALTPAGSWWIWSSLHVGIVVSVLVFLCRYSLTVRHMYRDARDAAGSIDEERSGSRLQAVNRMLVPFRVGRWVRWDRPPRVAAAEQ